MFCPCCFFFSELFSTESCATAEFLFTLCTVYQRFFLYSKLSNSCEFVDVFTQRCGGDAIQSNAPLIQNSLCMPCTKMIEITVCIFINKQTVHCLKLDSSVGQNLKQYSRIFFDYAIFHSFAYCLIFYTTMDGVDGIRCIYAMRIHTTGQN